MEHQAEKTNELLLEEIVIEEKEDIKNDFISDTDVLLISLPNKNETYIGEYLDFLREISDRLKQNAKIVVYGENSLLPMLTFGIIENKILNYRTWISIRKEIEFPNSQLPNETKGAIIFSKDEKPLHICKVRLPYTYCPACNKTTKDYGGKKHLFHEYGTLMSDVWKDFTVNSNEPLPFSLLRRIRDMFSIEENRKMVVVSLWKYTDWDKQKRIEIKLPQIKNETNEVSDNEEQKTITNSLLINGDSLMELRTIQSNTIDYVFVDPPYNIKKKYSGYDDNLEIEEYFSWCDEWLNECYRVLKPGRFLSILNLPLWCVRHYAFLSKKMSFSSWITWEALSRPARNIMPANYTILTMKKDGSKESFSPNLEIENELLPEADYYCLRQSCRKKRETNYKPLTDLWTDVHRLKHNSRRYDHPCQLPPLLMKRLISLYTNPGDIVLDCFNGVGTTTLSADVLGRRYVGIELIEKYHVITSERHNDVLLGLDPFRKNDISADQKTKNNEEKRNSSPKPSNGLTKRKVQLQIKALATELNKIPTLEDALEHLDIPKDFYETYFKSWSEVVSAAKTTGMNENKRDKQEDQIKEKNTQITLKL